MGHICLFLQRRLVLSRGVCLREKEALGRKRDNQSPQHLVAWLSIREPCDKSKRAVPILLDPAANPGKVMRRVVGPGIAKHASSPSASQLIKSAAHRVARGDSGGKTCRERLLPYGKEARERNGQ